MREIYDFTSGVYMGSIPEASHTFNVVGNMNEHQVAIGETTFDGVYCHGCVGAYGSLCQVRQKEVARGGRGPPFLLSRGVRGLAG